jgi:hypothetical protein
MYASGLWRGYWVQPLYGRQSMTDFHLRFRNGIVDGHGSDIVGRFVFHGDYDTNTGRVRMVKKYLGKHEVSYDGTPDGEGSIVGTWVVGDDDWNTGPFALQPVLGRPTGEEPIIEITK